MVPANWFWRGDNEINLSEYTLSPSLALNWVGFRCQIDINKVCLIFNIFFLFVAVVHSCCRFRADFNALFFLLRVLSLSGFRSFFTPKIDVILNIFLMRKLKTRFNLSTTFFFLFGCMSHRLWWVFCLAIFCVSVFSLCDLLYVIGFLIFFSLSFARLNSKCGQCY